MADDLAEVLLCHSQAEATQRSTISPVRQRVTLCVLFCTPLCGLSITLVVPRHLYSEGGSCSRWTVNISAIPSRKLLAADSYSCSRKRASCSSRLTPSSASHTRQAARIRFNVCAC